MTTLSNLRRALEDVPSVLLDPDDRRVLEDALNSIEALARNDIVPTAVTFVGGSGSGTSTMVNAALGASVAPVGVVRPTTDRVTMYGSSGPVAPAVPSEYVHVPAARPGVVVIDTPPWEHDADAVRAALAVADHAVLVVTPMRYADASVGDLADALSLDTTIVLNRIDASGEDLDALRDSVHRRFGQPIVEVREGEGPPSAVRSLIDTLPVDEDGYARAAVLRAAAAAASRRVARTAAAMAGRVADLAASVDEVDPSMQIIGGYTVLEEWPPTRAELVRLVESGRKAVDRAVSGDGSDALANRVEGVLPVWQPGSLAADLDAWHDACRRRFRDDARIRWRKAQAHALLDATAWRVSMNEGVSIPPRVRRVMGDRLAPARRAMHGDLQRLLEASVAARVQDWRSVVTMLATHTPGAVFGAADDLTDGS